MTISERIKSMRKEQKLTQEELSKKAGISTMSVRRYENGERSPDLSVIKKIADALDVSVAMLLTGMDLVVKEVSKKEYIESTFSELVFALCCDDFDGAFFAETLKRLVSAIKEFPEDALMSNIPNNIFSSIGDGIDDVAGILPEDIIADIKNIFGDVRGYCKGKTSSENLMKIYLKLNEIGQKKACDYIEDLTKIPEYQKKDDNED